MYICAYYMLTRFCTVPYPLGMSSFDEFMCINEDIIGEVVFDGYTDEQTNKFLNGLEEFKNNLMKIKFTEEKDEI